MSFSLPSLSINENGWGPSSIPEEFEGLPFLPFGKNDRLNRIADWTSHSQYSRYVRQGDLQSVFSFSSEDDSSFTLVDNQKVQTKHTRTKKYSQNQYSRVVKTTPTNQQTNNKKMRQQPRTGKKWRNNAYRYHRYVEKRTYDPSITVKSNWEKVDSIDLNALQKISGSIPTGEDIVRVGNVNVFDHSYLKMSVRNEKPLQNNESVFFNKTTSEDSVFKQIEAENIGNVYATDSIISLLMASTRAVYPWDIIVTRKGSNLYLDKREGSKIDLLTVGETSVEPPNDDNDSINSATQLSREATLIDQYFKKQVTNTNETISLDLNTNLVPNEFKKINESRCYVYRKWNLSDEINLIVRCNIDGIEQTKTGDNKTLIIHALNEYDSKISGIDWRTKLDNQPGAVFANELKSNSAKLAKWSACSLLANVDSLMLGYVSRQINNANKHSVLTVQQYKPLEFTTHITSSAENMWGIIKALINLLLQHPEGKYVLLKEPNESILVLYKTT